jgi:3-oxoacyl-[acyl-carrier protein] reductase
LERFKPGQPVIKGVVLIGGGGTPQLLNALVAAFKAMGAQTVAHKSLPQWMGLGQRSRHDDRPLGRGRPAG